MAHEINDPLADMPKHIHDTIPVAIQQKMKENQALQASIFELADVYSFLEQDVQELREFGSQNETDQAWRRSAYRAVFSWIEGVVYQMKQVAIHTQGGYYQAQFSRAEISFLLEESYYLTENGKVKTRNNNFVEIDKNLRFAYSKLVEGFNLSAKLEVERRGWNDFKKAIAIRNRLTHPKNVDNLFVSDADLKFLIETVDWFNEQYSKLIDGLMATVEPIREKIRAEGEANIQNMIENARTAFGKVSKVETVIAIIDELASEDIDAKVKNEKFEMMKSKLGELKIEIMNDQLKSS